MTIINTIEKYDMQPLRLFLDCGPKQRVYEQAIGKMNIAFVAWEQESVYGRYDSIYDYVGFDDDFIYKIKLTPIEKDDLLSLAGLNSREAVRDAYNYSLNNFVY